MSCQPYIFGTSPHDNTPQPYNYYGQSGWFTLPRNWYTRPTASADIQASPNSDFSNPCYICTLAQDGTTYVFQDLLLSKLMGTDGNNQD